MEANSISVCTHTDTRVGLLFSVQGGEGLIDHSVHYYASCRIVTNLFMIFWLNVRSCMIQTSYKIPFLFWLGLTFIK